MTKTTIDRTIRRKRRIRAGIVGTKEKPRLSVFRSNKYIYAQVFDDVRRITIASYSSLDMKKAKKYEKSKKTDHAKEIGKGLAAILKKKGIEQAVFDRNVYAYKGRVKALAEGLREGGLRI